MSLAACLLIGAAATAQFDPLVHTATLSQGLESPARLALTPGQVLVADPQANAVVRFDLAGAYVGTWSEPAGPVGIAVHPDGRVFVSRRDDAKVGIYDAGFNFIGFLGEGVVTFVRPTDLAVDASSGRIYVVDSGADKFCAFEANGTLAQMVGIRGHRSSEFKYPTSIAIDAVNDRIIVGDQDNFRVQVFSSSGLYARRFGYRIKYLPGGLSEGWMPRTLGVAVDAAGRIYAVDAAMSTLRVFTPDGAELGKVVDYGTLPGELQAPGDVAIDATGRVFVTNSAAGTVEVYAAPVIAAAGAVEGTHHRGTNSSEYDLFAQRRAAISRAGSGDTGESGKAALLVNPGGWDSPHMEDDLLCSRCHDIDGQPGGHLGLTTGQELLCRSCHNGAGQALAALYRPTTSLGMTHAWDVDAVSAAAGSVGPTPGGAIAAYLANDGKIKCATCHDQHNNDAGAPFLRAAPAALCRDCHADHIVHTPSGSWQPTCLECHEAHDATDRNLSLVDGTVHNQTLGVDKTVVFTATTGPNSFDDGDPAANDGICQVCHTATTFHTHDGAGLPHMDGTDCTDCHLHDAGFMPVGGCTICHATPQDNGDGVPAGGRRAVVGEFPVGDAHAHYGAELSHDSCMACHSTDTHMDGYIELIDADDGSIYRFVHADDLSSDPDVSDFCASCHDDDGATRLAAPMDPFGSGNVPPDAATKFAGALQWDQMYDDVCFGPEGTLRGVNSHHDISDSDQAYSGAKIECLNCHGAHTSSASQPVADPFDATTAWAGDTNTFCLACHSGGTGPLDPAMPIGVFAPIIDTTDPRWVALGVDWATILGGACVGGGCSSLRGIESCEYTPAPWLVDYDWTHSAHGLDSKRGWNGYSGAPGADMDCTVCHDPHGSNTPTNPEGNPYMIRDFIDGTMFVDDGNRRVGFNGPPWETFGGARDVVVTAIDVNVEWAAADGLCNLCHVEWFEAQHYHGGCSACETCHGHGALWGEKDWVGEDDDTACPLPPAPAPLTGGSPAGAAPDDGVQLLDEQPALHQWFERAER